MSQRREPYTKLFASWWCHPRTGPLSLAAGGLEARMLSWSAHHGADGRIPKASLVQLAGGASKKEIGRAIAELRSAGVVVEEGDAYVIRDYLDANISKERDEERRRGQNERQSRHRQSPVTRDVTGSVTRDQDVTNAVSLDHDHDHDQDHRAESASVARAHVREADVRPVPVEVEPKVRAAIGEAQRAEAARARLAPVWRERTGATPMELSALTPKAEVVSALAGLPDEPELSGVLGRFFDDPKMRERGWPIQWLLRNPAQWSGRAGAKGGHAPPRKNHEYEARSMTFDELMNEREAALGGGSHG